MGDKLVEILDKVLDAEDADGVEVELIETLLGEDPQGFAMKYAEHLTVEERRLLGDSEAT
ncbi:MAG: hypothetical protein A2289_22070 [Deltaproteobacteria bacterium RIFOXYA12_FULL_58_15]|nr:MAG: hypothetical protein A2289_22070 [Deltaproteobacteria bacterium RIFOXYA12_FULL_58_15]OGR12286.1 MAG: hypothetical protein A2341_20905 [Deltaproteobacteria bacterium RIFOXYB12_FULL_58_9]